MLTENIEKQFLVARHCLLMHAQFDRLWEVTQLDYYNPQLVRPGASGLIRKKDVNNFLNILL